MSELDLFTHFTQETQWLEEAHLKLQEQFETLKAKLDTSHQTLEQIITHISDGLLFITLNGIISLYNPAAASITCIPQARVLGTPFWEHFSDSLFGFPLAQALKSGHTPGRIDLLLSNGRQLEVAPTFIPEKGLLLLLNDRTSFKQLEATVQQNERLKEIGVMAATLAHEIRNPLGGIEGFASLLKRELKKPEELKMIEAILEGSRALNTLVTNVLEYSRPLTLHFVQTNLAQLIEETRTLAEASGYRCLVTIEKEHTVSVDPIRMQGVLLNLIRNSIESGSDVVEINLTQDGALLVKDQGEGMEREQLERIFTPFYTTKTTGTGLGLCEVAKVMRAHGGSIHIDSKKGIGTCITLNYAN